MLRALGLQTPEAERVRAAFATPSGLGPTLPGANFCPFHNPGACPYGLLLTPLWHKEVAETQPPHMSSRDDLQPQMAEPLKDAKLYAASKASKHLKCTPVQLLEQAKKSMLSSGCGMVWV